MDSFSTLIEFTDQELAYIKLAVSRMAPLVHRPEATVCNRILEKLRAEEVARFRLQIQDQHLN